MHSWLSKNISSEDSDQTAGNAQADLNLRCTKKSKDMFSCVVDQCRFNFKKSLSVVVSNVLNVFVDEKYIDKS